MAKGKDTAPVWKDVDEYFAFTRKHKVYGSEAAKLKKNLDRLMALPNKRNK